MIVGIHHVAIGVPDLDAALTFYGDALGFRVVQQTQWQGDNPLADAAIGLPNSHARMAMLKAANAHVELWEYSQPAPRDLRSQPNDLGYPHFALQVDDIQAEMLRLREHGMTFVGDAVDFGTSSAIYGKDPFGNIIELYEIRSTDIAQLRRDR